jgi:hypothetical protein
MGDEPPPKDASPDLSWPAIPTDGLGEEIDDQVSGLGASLVLTPTRVIVIRQGAHFRPSTGVRAWPYGTIRAVQLSPSKHGNGRIVLRVGPYPWQAVSLFIDAERRPAAERVVGQIRVRAARARRSSGTR